MSSAMNMQQKDISETFYHFVSMNPLGFLKGSGINESLNGWIEEQIEGMGMEGRLYSRLISSIMKMTPGNLEEELRHMDITFGEGRNEYFLRKLMLLTLWTGDYSTDDCTIFKKFIEDLLSRHEADHVGHIKSRRNSNSEPVRSKERYDEAFPALSFHADDLSSHTSLLNWADAVNSFTSLHHPSPLHHTSVKSHKKLSCTDVGRRVYRMVQQTELKTANPYHNNRAARSRRFYRHKRNKLCSNHRKKVLPRLCEVGEEDDRITDNEENYPYIEIVRRFQSWGLCEKVDEENPFPSILFPMKDFTSDVNRTVKDQNLVDEEGMKGIWMRMTNKTSGQSLCNISDVSIGEDSLLSPSPKLSWTNHVGADCLSNNKGDNALNEGESKIFKDIIFQNFYAYERILFDLLLQNGTYNFPLNCLDLESFNRTDGPVRVGWNGGETEGSDVKGGKSAEDQVVESCGKSAEVSCKSLEEPGHLAYWADNENNSENTLSLRENERRVSEGGGALFNESFYPRFSTPKYPKLDGEKYDAVNMLDINYLNNHTNPSRTPSTQRRNRIRVNLEDFYNLPGSEVDKEFKLDVSSNSCFELCHFDDFENDADDECHSVSTIIFSDDDEDADTDELSSSSFLSSSSKNSEDKGQGGKEEHLINKRIEELSNRFESPSSYRMSFSHINKDIEDDCCGELSIESIEQDSHLPHFCNSLLRDSYYNVDSPKTDTNNNHLGSSAPLECLPYNTIPPGFSAPEGNPWKSHCSSIDGWDPFIALSASTKQLMTFSQSKLDSVVKNTSTQPRSNAVHQPTWLSCFSDVGCSNHEHSAANHPPQKHAKLVPIYMGDLGVLSSALNLFEVNNKQLEEECAPLVNLLSTHSPLFPGHTQLSTEDHKPFVAELLSPESLYDGSSASYRDSPLHLQCKEDEVGRSGELLDDFSVTSVENYDVLDEHVSTLHHDGKENGDSILEVVSEHLKKLRDDFENGVLKERLTEESWSEGGEEGLVQSVLEGERAEFTGGWGGVIFNQVECQKDFAYEPPKVVFY